MAQQALGTFEVQANRQPPYDAAPGATLARVRLTKQFQGDLEATSTVEMLSAITQVQGSAGYVAIERVEGSLRGNAGTFVLQHSGLMTRGTPTLSVVVVPDSGTGALRGLSGSMRIDIRDGQHAYTLDYELEAG